MRYTDGQFFQYGVSLSCEDGRPVEGKGVERTLLVMGRRVYSLLVLFQVTSLSLLLYVRMLHLIETMEVQVLMAMAAQMSMTGRD